MRCTNKLLRTALKGIGSNLVFGLSIVLSLLSRTAQADARELASRIWDRLAGSPLPLSDPRRQEMENAILAGNIARAAEIAVVTDGFINVTLKAWATPMSTRDEDPFANLNDFVAMVLGTARDNRDARELLYGNFSYVGDSSIIGLPAVSVTSNAHYDFLETSGINLAARLVRSEPQRTDNPDPAGVLTSRAWAMAHFDMGTNRRPLEYAFLQFLCTPIKKIADGTVVDSHVRRDVDRSPGGSSSAYVRTCRACHGGLDGLSSAFGHFDFTNNQMVYSPGIAAKMNKNANVYPEGKVVVDDSWANLWTDNQNAEFGWRGELQGRGVQSMGYMLANSAGFSRCLAKRAFKSVCHRSSEESEEGDIQELAHQFEESNYNLRVLFQRAAILPRCLGE